jgi:hypothetical protein
MWQLGGGNPIGVICFLLGLGSASVFTLLSLLSVASAVAALGVVLGGRGLDRGAVGHLGVPGSVQKQGPGRQRPRDRDEELPGLRRVSRRHGHRPVHRPRRDRGPALRLLGDASDHRPRPDLRGGDQGRRPGPGSPQVPRPQAAHGRGRPGSSPAWPRSPTSIIRPTSSSARSWPASSGSRSATTSRSSRRCRTSTSRTWRSKAAAPRTRRFRISGIFYSGFDEYDRRLMYTSLAQTQALKDNGDRAMGVELKVPKTSIGRPRSPPSLATSSVSRRFQVQDWYELNHKPVQGAEDPEVGCWGFVPGHHHRGRAGQPGVVDGDAGDRQDQGRSRS